MIYRDPNDYTTVRNTEQRIDRAFEEQSYRIRARLVCWSGLENSDSVPDLCHSRTKRREQ
jgi:hypothetical protein